jgi:hypothetical protein
MYLTCSDGSRGGIIIIIIIIIIITCAVKSTR